jgi:hypothetical protein
MVVEVRMGYSCVRSALFSAQCLLLRYSTIRHVTVQSENPGRRNYIYMGPTHKSTNIICVQFYRPSFVYLCVSLHIDITLLQSSWTGILVSMPVVTVCLCSSHQITIHLQKTQEQYPIILSVCRYSRAPIHV